MMKKQITLCLLATLTGLLSASQASAAIALDRTRVIFDGKDKSVTLNVSNRNNELPYLAQSWLENDKGVKITDTFTALPPLQRIDPGKSSQVKIQSLPAAAQLPQDRESLFYFNLREIPPKSEKPNVLQIALQTRVKMFYRPAALAISRDAAPYQEKITLARDGNHYTVKNPTPYYVTLVNARPAVKSGALDEFTPVMVAPKSSAKLNVPASELGNSPVLTYINDYGGRPQLQAVCSGADCTVKPVKNVGT